MSGSSPADGLSGQFEDGVPPSPAASRDFRAVLRGPLQGLRAAEARGAAGISPHPSPASGVTSASLDLWQQPQAAGPERTATFPPPPTHHPTTSPPTRLGATRIFADSVRRMGTNPPFATPSSPLTPRGLPTWQAAAADAARQPYGSRPTSPQHEHSGGEDWASGRRSGPRWAARRGGSTSGPQAAGATVNATAASTAAARAATLGDAAVPAAVPPADAANEAEAAAVEAALRQEIAPVVETEGQAAAGTVGVSPLTGAAVARPPVAPSPTEREGDGRLPLDQLPVRARPQWNDVRQPHHEEITELPSLWSRELPPETEYHSVGCEMEELLWVELHPYLDERLPRVPRRYAPPAPQPPAAAWCGGYPAVPLSRGPPPPQPPPPARAPLPPTNAHLPPADVQPPPSSATPPAPTPPAAPPPPPTPPGGAPPPDGAATASSPSTPAQPAATPAAASPAAATTVVRQPGSSAAETPPKWKLPPPEVLTAAPRSTATSRSE
ncbi:hypothetical protein PLESTB_001547500 [Pleodorina starrii]|uniref:Uncharacterized protein n=1 Tax=Pleodorina starrii TaxID=330485 RepID=A0A9W6BXX5_9CHLO|nr:hypothetical protein PLESTB_001547500 [Pleodorina starrii]